MPRHQSLAIFIISAFIAIVILSISILMTNPSDETMPTLAALENVSPSPTLQYYIASEHRSERNIANQFIVQFDKTIQSQSDAKTLVTDVDAKWIADIPQLQGAIIEFDNTPHAQQLDTLSSAFIIEPNYTVQSLITYPTNDPMLDLQWAWQKIDIPRRWNAGNLDSPVTVAVIDSGVCFSHPDLQGRFLDTGYDFVDNDNDPSDQMGHGCAISGIIAANLDNGIGIAGIAPNVNILPIRVLDADGIGTYADVMSAIFYAVDNGADIINLSLGGQNHSQLLEQAINYAVDNGVQIVAGTGNTGQQGVLYPARYEPVIAVGSHNIDGNRSSFSTYGDEVDVLAPGENIVTTNLNGEYSYFSGTSMAAPHVSALLALSDYGTDSVDFIAIMPTVDPLTLTLEAVEALDVNTNTPLPSIPTMTPTSTILAHTNTPSPFICENLSVEAAFPSFNAVTINISNSGFLTTLESIDVDFPAIAEFPDLHLQSVYFNGNEIWQGDGTLTAPIYIDETILSHDGSDLWTPNNPAALSNEITYFHLFFGASPDFLEHYWTISDLVGTELAFYNPANPQSPCVLQIPEDLYKPQPTPTPVSATAEVTITPTLTPTPTATPIGCENYADIYTLGTVQSDLVSDLRRAVECANQSVEDNTIDLNGQTVTFDYAPSAYDYYSFNALEPIVSASSGGQLTIQNGSLDRNNDISLCDLGVQNRALFRLLITEPESYLTLSNMTIRNGCALDFGSYDDKHGGAIYNQGTLFMDYSLITSNKAINVGGGVYNADNSTFTVTDSVFTHNAGISGGAIFSDHNNQLTITNSTLSYNSAYGDCNCGGGGISISYSGDSSITNSTITNNFADGFGGGIENNGSMLTIVDSIISDNTSLAYGGGINHDGNVSISNIIRSTIANNYAKDYGGGILHDDGVLNIVDSTISHNTAENYGGGGIDVRDTLTITGSTIDGNITDGYGAGIRHAYSDQLTLSNSTVYGNATTGGGGGFFLAGTSITTLINTTVSSNAASTTGGGIYVSGSASVSLTNSLIADSTNAEDCVGTVTNAGINLIEDGTCGALTNGQLTGDPKLDPAGLQLTTGSVPTIPLLPDSPAIDAGDDTQVASISYDQRGEGFPRIFGSHVDLGAYEYQPIVATNTPSPIPSATLTPYPTSTPTATLTPTSTFAPSLTFTPTPSAPVTSLTPSVTLTPLPTPTDIPTSCDTNVLAGDRYALLDAFQYAQTNTNIHSICLSESLYTLSEYNNVGTDGHNGFPLITRDLTLVGNGATIMALEPSYFRYFEIAPGASLTIIDTKFDNGDATMGGMFYNNDGTLTLVDSEFANSTATNGGVVYSYGGDVHITNSVFRDNEAFTGGAIYSSGSYSTNPESLTIFGSSFLHNTASRGGAISSTFDLSVYHSKFIGNEALIDYAVFTSYGSYPNLIFEDNCIYNNVTPDKLAYAVTKSDITRNWWGSALGVSPSLLYNVYVSNYRTEALLDCLGADYREIQTFEGETNIINLDYAVGGSPPYEYTELSTPTNGTLTGTFPNYTFVAGFSNQTLTYTVTDSEGYSVTGAVEFTIISPTSTPLSPLSMSSISATFIDETTGLISWSDDNADESGYRIMHRVSDTWSEVGVVAPNLTTYYDATIDCGTDLTYDYQIQAYRYIDGDQAFSGIASLTTGDCPFIEPDGLSPDTITDTQVGLSWTDNSILESNYIISRKTTDQNWAQVGNLGANTITFIDTTIECERQYQYRLQGYQALFDRYTQPITTTVTAGQCAVAVPDAISTTVTSNQTSINWNPIPSQQTTQIIVERAEQESVAIVGLSPNWQIRATLAGGTSVFTDDDMRCGMIYSYRLRGYNERYDEYTGYTDTIQVTTNECPVPVTNTIGLYHDGRWVFREGVEDHSLITTFRFGPQESGWIPLTGDWDGDGVDGIGIYKDGVFALRDISGRGTSDYIYHFGNTQNSWQPIVGDWDGDGVDSVGLYREGRFVLTNSNTSPSIDYQFMFGRVESGWMPIAGDWFNHGRDYVGIYKDGVFNLHNSLNNSSSGEVIRFGSGTGWIPVAGDWDADGYTTIGLYKDNNWRLSNTNQRTVDISIRFNYFNGQGLPLASYRGDGEALALFAMSEDININNLSLPVEVTHTPEPILTSTQISVTVTSTNPTITPTLTLVSNSEDITVPSTPPIESTPLPDIIPSPTLEPTLTPTMTLTSTRIVPTVTPQPIQSEQPSASDSETESMGEVFSG